MLLQLMLLLQLVTQTALQLLTAESWQRAPAKHQDSIASGMQQQ
jgi:hypothetical protein